MGGLFKSNAREVSSNPTNNTAPMTPSKAVIGMTAADEQASRERATAAAGALAAQNPNTRYRASSSLLGTTDANTTTTTG